MKIIYQSPTNSLANSKAYYEKLNYQIREVEEGLLVSDGKFILCINNERVARAGVRIYKENWDSELLEIKKVTAVTTKENFHLFADPSGAWVYLSEGKPSWGTSIEDELLSQETKALTGNFAGLALESADIQRSIQLWKILGFEKTMGGVEQGWLAMENNQKVGVSLMIPNSCPHLFFNPSFSFFNGKNNLSLIEQMRKRDVSFAEEVTYFNKEGIVDNVILKDPGGFGMFIFSD